MGAVVMPSRGKGVQIASGSYVGNGKYGGSDQNTLVFPFEPKLVLISPNQSNAGVIAIFSYQGYYGINIHMSSMGDYNYEYAKWAGNSMSWYSSYGADYQMNKEGIVYYYVAFG